MTATVPVNLEGGPQCYQHAGWQDGASAKMAHKTWVFHR